MPLSAGTRLGPYEILAAIGAGGMGEVYRARDTRLDRSVAIKVLPPEVSADPDRRARFEREAKTIAGLNHPRICTLHDVGEYDGSMYLVMEHLVGDTLAERLTRGPLPLEHALVVATEIADALSAAHRQGVIHRDLKPGNVMLTKTGAKLLDFGLAKLTGHGEQAAAASLASVPTQTRPLTSEGAIVGTLQYMAPEQVEGKPADARTDLWALGAILYEMLTGKRAFAGTSAASLIGNIMNAEPSSLSTLQPLTPPALDRLVRQCLAKAPDDRPDTAHDVANDVRWLREASGVAAPTAVQPQRRRAMRTALVVAGGLLLFVAGVGVMWLLRPAPPVTPMVRSALLVSPAEELNAGGVASTFQPSPGGSRTALAWTPDGQALVFVGRRGGVQQLYVRRLDTAEARVLPNTEGAQVPAVSPDGQWVAFWAHGAIRKTSISGGAIMALASDLRYPPWGLVWDAGGRLFFGREEGAIWEIPPQGTPAAVTTVGEAEVAHILPWPLPGERTLLYTVRKRLWSWGDEEVVAQKLATGERRVVLKDAADARYVPTGHLVFLRRGVLFAVPFDAERLEVRGPEVPVLDGIVQALTGAMSDDVTGAGQFAVATTGMLGWVAGPAAVYENWALVTVDRAGHIAPLSVTERSYQPWVRLSPDGRRLAVGVRTLTEAGLWLCDLDRGTQTLRTVGGEVLVSVWSPDGRSLVFDWLTEGRRSLAAQPADATTPPRVLVPGNLMPSSFAPSGRQLAAVRNYRDIVNVTVAQGTSSVQPLIETPSTESWPEISPDGRWLAYGSNVSGRMEVYVGPYSGPGPAEPVSVEGGWSPAWHPTGREIFFVSLPDPAGKRRMMAVDFSAGSPPRIGRPRMLFEFDPAALRLACTAVRCYDVAADGQRFYAVYTRTPPTAPVITHINLVEHWFEELKAKVPAGR